MTSNLYLAPLANFTQTTLNGAITSGAGSITLNSVTNLQFPGYVVIDRTDSNGVSTPTAREVVSYTGISGNQLTGCTRGTDGGTPLGHNDGAVVETMPTIGMWNSLTTIVGSGLDGNGLLKATISPVSIVNIQSSNIYASQASIGVLKVSGLLDISGASISGFGLNPVWRTSGSYSGPTTFVAGNLMVPQAGTLQWISIVTRFVASGTSVGFDVKKNGSSIFSNATMRPAITAGGTYVSTASIGTKNIGKGDILSTSVDSMLSGAGLITDFTLQGGTY